jgi:hypothetical protein
VLEKEEKSRLTGFFTWLRLVLFGSSKKCRHERCEAKFDPRCRGQLCSEHCNSTYGCGGFCIKAARWDEPLKELKKMGHTEAFVLSNGDSAVYACLRCGLRMNLTPGEHWASTVLPDLVECDFFICRAIHEK